MIAKRLAIFFLVSANCALAVAQGEATVIPGGALRSGSASNPAAAPAAASPINGPTVVVPLRNATTEPSVIRGNDRVIASPPVAAPLTGPANSFRFEEAPMLDVVHIVLRDILKVDYMIHPPISGNVTLATRGQVSADQAAYMLEGALLANGLMMAKDTRGTYHVGRPETLRGIVSVPRQAGSGPLPPGTGAVVVPLEFVGATEMATILRPLLPPDALVRVDPARNLLVLAGNRGQTEGWLSIIAMFDVDFLKGMSVGLYPLKYASVKEVEAALRLISSSGAGRASAQAPQAGGIGQGAAEATPESFALGAVRIMPIERLSSILVVSPRAAYLDEAQKWIERLDKPGGNNAEQTLHVYPVQNGSAKHLAEVLNGIYGSEPRAQTSAATNQSQTQTSNGIAPGLGASTGTTNLYGGGGMLGGLGQAGFNSNTQSGQGAGVRGNAQATSQSSLQLGSLRVVADEANNAILVYGTAAEYAKIESTLKRLDLPPTQVLIEASIIEVTLNDDLKYGLQWVFNNGLSNGRIGTGVLSQADGGVLGSALAGFSYTLGKSMGSVRAVLNALAEKSLIKVISSPSLMVLDNHTAQIIVGDQQPIRSTETVTEGGVRSSSIQYKDTGVALAVTPSVNSGNMVTMLINQSVTDVGAEDGPTGQRSFLQRQIASKVAVRSGEAIVLGGLIRDNSTNGSAGIPLLHEIPLLGGLFGTKDLKANRTELLVVITPRVVRSDQDAREVSAEIRDRMRSFIGHQPFGPGAPPVPSPFTAPAGNLFVPADPKPIQ